MPQCGICEEHEAKYTCPRCAIQSCSLNCWSSHSNSCTEAFAKDQVQQALTNRRVTNPDSVAETNAALSRSSIHSSLSNPSPINNIINHSSPEISEEERVEALVDLVKKLDAGTPLTQADLPPALADDFQSALNDGRLEPLLTPWLPWWKPSPNPHNQLPISIPSNPSLHQSTTTPQSSLLAAPPPQLPPPDQLLPLHRVIPNPDKRGISNTIIWSIVEAVVVYCLTIKSLNGPPDQEHHIDSGPVDNDDGQGQHPKEDLDLLESAVWHVEFASMIIETSSTLHGSPPLICSSIQDVIDALEAALPKEESSTLSFTPQELHAAWIDCAAVFKSPPAVLRALWHLKNICETASQHHLSLVVTDKRSALSLSRTISMVTAKLTWLSSAFALAHHLFPSSSSSPPPSESSTMSIQETNNANANATNPDSANHHVKRVSLIETAFPPFDIIAASIRQMLSDYDEQHIKHNDNGILKNSP